MPKRHHSKCRPCGDVTESSDSLSSSCTSESTDLCTNTYSDSLQSRDCCGDDCYPCESDCGECDDCYSCPDDGCADSCDTGCKDRCCPKPSPKPKSEKKKKSKSCAKDCAKDCCSTKYTVRTLDLDSSSCSSSSSSDCSLISKTDRHCCDDKSDEKSCDKSCDQSCDISCDDCGCDDGCDTSCNKSVDKCCKKVCKSVESLKVKELQVTFGSKFGHPWAKYNTEDNAIYINGKAGPLLTLRRKMTYEFTIVGDGIHGFFLTDSPIGGLGSQMIKGGFAPIIPAKGQKQTVRFTVHADTPNVGFYQCGKFAFQGGVFIVRD